MTETPQTDEERSTDESAHGSWASISRRGVLAASALGLTAGGFGTASGAEDDTERRGPPFAKKGHDHGGDYLGESEPVDQLDVDDLDAETINGRIEVTPDDDLNATLAEAEFGDTVVLSGGRHVVDEPVVFESPESMRNNPLTIRGQGYANTTVTRSGDFPIFELRGSGAFGKSRLKTLNFEGLSITANNGSTADLLNAKVADGLRFLNVNFGGYGCTGNNIYAEGCFDWKFYACHFAQGGTPERGTADIYAAAAEKSNTNNFHFVNCRWERIRSYALYADDTKSGGGSGAETRRFKVSNCKFHGSPGQDTPPVPFIGGAFRNIQITNSHMGPAHEGFIDIEGTVSPRGRGGILLSNNLFAFFNNGDSPAIHVKSNRVCLSNNYFHDPGTENPAIAVDGGDAVLNGNSVYHGHVEVLDGSATVSNNQIAGSLGDAIRVAADGAVVDGNTVVDPGGDGVNVVDAVGCVVGDNRVTGGGIVSSGSSDYAAVSGNVVANGEVRLAGSNNATAANVTFSPGESGGGSGGPVEGEGYPIPNATVTPDGDLSEVSSRSSIDLSEDTTTHNEASLGGSVWLAWDDTNFYVVAEVEDDVHSQPETGATTWKGDGIQFGVSPGAPGNTTEFTAVNLALTTEGPQVFSQTQPTGTDRGLVDAATLAATRDEDATVTRYELAMPWSELAVDTDPGTFAFSFIVNDNDGDGRTGWVAWAGGIGSGKDTAEFRLVELTS